MRKYHYLKTNAKLELPSWLCFIDTEANRETITPDLEVQTLWFGYYELWRYYRNGPSRTVLRASGSFSDPIELLSKIVHLMPTRSKVYIFAHNWQYDAAMLSLDTSLAELGFVVTKQIVDETKFIVDARIGSKTLAFRDSTNLYPFSLAKIGEQLGIKKIAFPAGNESFASWLEYCKRDVTVLRHAIFTWLDFITENDLGNFQPTLAAQAFGAFRHRFMKHRLLIHADLDTLRLERDGYYGGRVECFYLGPYRAPVHALDVNSMYPFVMRSFAYPTRLIRTYRALTLDHLRLALEKYGVMARVKLKTQEPAYPFRHKGKLIFPTGTFTTTLSTPELEHALRHRHIVSVFDAAVYEMAPIFINYVDYFYALRSEYKAAGNTVFDFIAKLFLNSLYGKFGQTARGWIDSDETELPPNGEKTWYVLDPDTGDLVRHRSLFDQVQKLVKTGESYNSSPAIAAHVTAYARMYLWKLIKLAGVGQVLYCDTDSLIVSEAGLTVLQDIIDGQALGALKVEKSAPAIEIRGLKDYSVNGKRTTKGISTKAVQLDTNTYRQPQFAKWSVLATQGITGQIYVRQVTKHLTRLYSKGLVASDGWVTPIVLP